MLGGGLEPHFRVLFSAIFMVFSLGNFHQGRKLWKVAEAKVWSILVNPRTFFMCVFYDFLATFHGPVKIQYSAFLIQGAVSAPAYQRGLRVAAGGPAALKSHEYQAGRRARK